MLLSLGMFVFSTDTAAFTELQRRTSWRHAKASRVGARPASQYVGPGDELISLPGLIAPGQTGDVASLAELRAMGDAGDAYLLVTGTGEVLGSFVIEELNTRSEYFFPDGTPRKIEFDLSLSRADDAEDSSAGAEAWGDL